MRASCAVKAAIAEVHARSGAPAALAAVLLSLSLLAAGGAVGGSPEPPGARLSTPWAHRPLLLWRATSPGVCARCTLNTGMPWTIAELRRASPEAPLGRLPCCDCTGAVPDEAAGPWLPMLFKPEAAAFSGNLPGATGVFRCCAVSGAFLLRHSQAHGWSRDQAHRLSAENGSLLHAALPCDLPFTRCRQLPYTHVTTQVMTNNSYVVRCAEDCWALVMSLKMCSWEQKGVVPT